MISFVSFDISSISSLGNVTIKDVSLIIPISDIKNHPELAGDKVRILTLDYGTLEYLDLQIVGELLDIIRIFPSKNMKIAMIL
jgi:hypothetical protein